MSLTVYFICAALIQLSTAQVLSYIQRNPVPQSVEKTARYVSNVANTISNAMTNPNNAITITRVPSAVSVTTNTIATPANTLSSSNTNVANMNAVNAVANQNVANNYAGSQNLANANYAINYANIASQNAANALVTTAANMASQNAGNSLQTKTERSVLYPEIMNTLASNPPNYANVYASQNLGYTGNGVPATLVNPAIQVPNANLNNAALAHASLANINGNTATFNLGTNGNTFSITSGSPGAQGFGISINADALEVGGTVAVNGQIPIFGSVAVNGNVPTDGAATVSYNCGGKQVPISI